MPHFAQVGGMIPPIADLGQLQGLETGMQKPVQNSATGEHWGLLGVGDGRWWDFFQRWGSKGWENGNYSRVEDHFRIHFRYFNGVLDGI